VNKLAVAIGALCLTACGNSDEEAPLTVFDGDSITWAWGVAGYADPLITDLVLNSVDVGVGGTTCLELEAVFNEDVLALHPATLVLECGTNDIRYNLSNDTGPLFRMIEMAQKARVRVVVATLPPNTGWPLLTEGYPQQGEALYALWNKEILDGARSYGYAVVNYNLALSIKGEQNSALFLSDGTHPDIAGYRVMWTALKPVLEGETQGVR
jgi:lysophospholipase L1-like esterase